MSKGSGGGNSKGGGAGGGSKGGGGGKSPLENAPSKHEGKESGKDRGNNPPGKGK